MNESREALIIQVSKVPVSFVRSNRENGKSRSLISMQVEIRIFVNNKPKGQKRFINREWYVGPNGCKQLPCIVLRNRSDMKTHRESQHQGVSTKIEEFHATLFAGSES